MRPSTLASASRRSGGATAALLVIVVVAAGASGAALLIAPGETDRYFSWTLRPPAAAALIGGFYLASAVVFAVALALPWSQVRTLVVGVYGLAVPTLVLTLRARRGLRLRPVAGWPGSCSSSPPS